MSILKFKALHLTANGNVLLEPLEHKQPIPRRTKVKEGKAIAEIFDTIASVEKPLYLAKPVSKIENGSILTGEIK